MTTEPAKIEVPTMIPCPEGDIFSIPTKADLVNAFSKIGQIPSKLEAKLLEFRSGTEREIGELYQQLKNGEGLTDEQRQGILSTISGLELISQAYANRDTGLNDSIVAEPKTVGGHNPFQYNGTLAIDDIDLSKSPPRKDIWLRNGDTISFAHYLGATPEDHPTGGIFGRYDLWSNSPQPPIPYFLLTWASNEPFEEPIEYAGYKYIQYSRRLSPTRVISWTTQDRFRGREGIFWFNAVEPRIVWINFRIGSTIGSLEPSWWDTNYYTLPNYDDPRGTLGLPRRPYDVYHFWFSSYTVKQDIDGDNVRDIVPIPDLPTEWQEYLDEAQKEREEGRKRYRYTAQNQNTPDPFEELARADAADKAAEILTALLLIDEVIKTVRDLMKTIEDALEPWWNKDPTRNWQKECNDAITKMMAEYHLYIPIKIAEFVKKFFPINFKISFFGITIDILELITSPDYKKYLQDQISGHEIFKQIQDIKGDIEKIDEELNKLKEDPQSVSAEAEAKLLEEKQNLEERVDDLTLSRQKFVDKIYKLLPDHCKAFDGELGLEDVDAKVEQAVQCIELEIKDWMLNWHLKAFAKLIDLFDEIWELLGLPDLPFSEIKDVLDLDVNELIDKAVQYIKDEFDKTKLGIQKKIDAIDKTLEENPDMDIAAKEELMEERKKLEDELYKELREFRQRIRDSILELSIFGMSVREIIGDEIDTSVKSIEQEVAEFKLALQDFKVNWASKLFWAWVKVIKKFLDKIGLGKLFKLLNLTFCDFLKQVGLPLGISLNIPDLGEIAGNPIADIGSFKPKVSLRGVSVDESLDETSFEADGSRVDFPTDGSGSNTYVFIDGVRQNPNTYTDNGDGTITFDSAPTNGIVSVFLSDKSLPAL